MKFLPQLPQEIDLDPVPFPSHLERDRGAHGAHGDPDGRAGGLGRDVRIGIHFREAVGEPEVFLDLQGAVLLHPAQDEGHGVRQRLLVLPEHEAGGEIFLAVKRYFDSILLLDHRVIDDFVGHRHIRLAVQQGL